MSLSSHRHKHQALLFHLASASADWRGYGTETGLHSKDLHFILQTLFLPYESTTPPCAIFLGWLGDTEPSAHADGTIRDVSKKGSAAGTGCCHIAAPLAPLGRTDHSGNHRREEKQVQDIKCQPNETISPFHPSRDQAMLGLDLFSNKSLARRHLHCSAQALEQALNPASKDIGSS